MNEEEKRVLNQNKDTLKPLFERLVKEEREKAVHMEAGYKRDVRIDGTFTLEDIINQLFTEPKNRSKNYV